MCYCSVWAFYLWPEWSFKKTTTCRPPEGQSHSSLVMFSWITPFVFSFDPVCLSPPVGLFAANGAAVALPGRVAGAYLHRAGQEQEEPFLLLQQQRNSLAAAQTAGGRPLRLHAEAALLAGRSDRHGNRGVRRWGGRHLHDSQSAQCCDPGLLYVLLLSDATRVCVQPSSVSCNI